MRKGNCLNKQETVSYNKSTGQERIKNTLERKQKEQGVFPIAHRSGGGTDGWRERIQGFEWRGGTVYPNQLLSTLFSKSHPFAQK